MATVFGSVKQALVRRDAKVLQDPGGDDGLAILAVTRVGVAGKRRTVQLLESGLRNG